MAFCFAGVLYVVDWMSEFCFSYCEKISHFVRFKCIRKIYNLLIIKANEMHYFSNLFDKVLYMFRTSPLSIIRSISTLYASNMYLSC